MIAQFALRLCCGISLTWLLLPRKRITAGFFRIQMLLALALAALGAIAIGRFTEFAGTEQPVLPIAAARGLCVVLAAVCYVGSIAWTLDRRSAGTLCGYAVAGLSTGVLVLSSVSPAELATRLGLLTIVSEIATSLLIGGATAGMLLGHWYLTAPTMSIDPLYRANACFASAAGLRFLASLCGLALAWPSLDGGTPALWLAMRWLAGILSPLLLAAMVARILRYRNTQAATGVLFVGVIVTFIGELSAMLASRQLHVPL